MKQNERYVRAAGDITTTVKTYRREQIRSDTSADVSARDRYAYIFKQQGAPRWITTVALQQDVPGPRVFFCVCVDIL